MLDTDDSVKLIQVVGRRWNTTTAAPKSIEAAGSGMVCIALKHSANISDINALINQQLDTETVA